MNKQLFDDAIGEVPPSTIDVDAVITRGRRAARIRRVANPVVAAGVAVVLLTGAVAYTMTRGDDGGAQVGGQPTKSESPTTSTSTSKVPLKMPPEGCSRPDLESSAEVIARLTPVTKAAFQAERPDLPVDALAFSHYYLDDPAAANPPVCHRHAGFEAEVDTDGPEGQGNVAITVQAAYFDPRGFCDEIHNGYCEETTGPDGETIVNYTPSEENGVAAKVTYVLRPDGTLILASAENAASATLPLDHDQLAAIATDPGMTLFP
jgi:hypothetical protein